MFGRTLQKARVKRNIARLEAARRTGMNQAALWRIENGDRNPTLDSLEKIAKALSISIVITEKGDTQILIDGKRVVPPKPNEIIQPVAQSWEKK